MSHPLPNMIESTLQKIRDMVEVNSVVGDPITTPEGVTILPICKIRYGFGGGGADFASKQPSKPEYPFGGGTGVGAQITPIAFLVIKGESVRMLPIAAPASTTDGAAAGSGGQALCHGPPQVRRCRINFQ